MKIFDPTYSASVHHCARAHQHAYYERLTPAQLSTRLLMGIAGHAALRELYRSAWNEDVALKALREAWGEHRPLALAWLTLARMEEVIGSYLRYWREREPYRTLVLCEEPLTVTSGGLTIGGIPDRIVDDQGKLWVIDTKFTTGYLENLKTKLRFGHQLRTYCLLASEKIGQEVTSAVADIVRVTDKKTEFVRVTYDYTPDQLTETLAWHKAAELLDLRRADFGGDLPQNPGVHCKFCDFAQLCEVSSPALREGRKKMYYRVKPKVNGLLASGADMS